MSEFLIGAAEVTFVVVLGIWAVVVVVGIIGMINNPKK